ncbi:glyoxalase [Enemella evansiae]|uniref:Glyoxalase n=1 Tax=Enemella evansiae TaxID=2016499 RepID=A0A255G0K1_9ACTN|nr:VOC family protein [Enemella evansiae]OYO09467.1 glyoxalase [Enemella evansiae]OYO15297.1 glyoxalase [Enemella evansiae]OYO20364.1 glyoxalase [Enemella evansiae]
MINLQDLAYVRIGTRDLDTQVAFATEIVGLELVEHTDQVATFRADNRRHCVQFVPGEPRALSSAFSLADEAALAAAAEELRAAGIDVHEGTADECAERHVLAFISFSDPAGNVVELVSGQTHTESRPVAFTRPVGITEFGHLGLEAPDVKEAEKFWTKHFNLKVSDRIGANAVLMRFDPVHHKLAVFADQTGLGHVNFQVASIDDLMRNWRFLEHHGIKIIAGPGRHPQSTAVFLYFKGPEDVTWEYSFGVREIPEDQPWVPRDFEPSEIDFIDMWKGLLPKAGTPWSERNK